MDESRKQHLGLRAGEVFTPAAPIDKKALFAGRKKQLRQVVDATNQQGQHAMVYGERGVGKTSLANVLTETIQNPAFPVIAPHVNCDSDDDYSSLWRKIFSEIHVKSETRQVGFVGSTKQTLVSVSDIGGTKIKLTTADVRRTLALLGAQVVLIIIVDEFDRLAGSGARRMFADTIKLISDQPTQATVVVVGVADSVVELIQEHESVERNLVQVQMPRMSLDELSEIVENGIHALGIQMDEAAKGRIAHLSRGLPHYTHLLARHAVRSAVDKDEELVKQEHVDSAIRRALDEAQQSIKTAYHKATMSTRKDHLYVQVLLACALARTDELGYFAPGDVREPMSRIMGRAYDTPNFARHLNDFCGDERGRILQKTGVPHRFRYRFGNPLLQPYILMDGLQRGFLSCFAETDAGGQ